MRAILCTLFLVMQLQVTLFGQAWSPIRAELTEVRKIWDGAPHNAFTDLVRWNDFVYCAFREGQGHAGDLGILRVIRSADGADWESTAEISLEDYDLRDAAISVTPDGRLMLSGGAQQIVDGQHRTGSFSCFSADGLDWSAPEMVLPAGRWLWRWTWHDRHAYGIAYATPDGRPHSSLHRTSDGIKIETIQPELLGEGGWPTEARIRFDQTGQAMILHRRDGEADNSAYLGFAQPPYEDWTWHDLSHRIGGPNFLQLPDGNWVACGRLYDHEQRTELLYLDLQSKRVIPILRLPSGGDTSYPGLIWHNDELWISYYSSHEERTSIYLAKVRISPNCIDIGDRRELFVDPLMIDACSGDARRKLHHPSPQEKVLALDEPWEGVYSAYFTVMQDDYRYRMYYRGLPAATHDIAAAQEVTCYAESLDGIHWTKPDLGIFEVQGSKHNNVILANHAACHNFAPFLDENPACAPEQKYKAIGRISQFGTAESGLTTFVSADGIHWDQPQQEPVITKGAFDSQNIAFWSAAEQKYVCYFRVFRQGIRWIARATSADFLHWDEPVDLEVGDQIRQHLYTNQLVPYARAPHIYIGTPTRFFPGRKVLSDEKAAELGTSTAFDFRNDCADITFVSSRGHGPQFDRSFLEAFLRPGLDPKNWTSRASYAAHGITQPNSNELSFYVNHNCGYESSHVRRYSLRPDGFVSVSAGFAGGEIVTRPLLFSGNRLEINYSTSAAGGLRVELQDVDGQAIPGFGADDCPEIIGDEILRHVDWNAGGDVSALQGKEIRVRFLLSDADLFSFRFAAVAESP